MKHNSKSSDYFFHFQAKDSTTFHENDYDYSMIQIHMEFNRTWNGQSKVFSSFHAPTGIFAILSLVSYSMEPDQVPGRMGLLVTLALIMINTYNSLDIPSNRGFSTMEIWFTGTLLPVLFAIFEFGMILVIRKYKLYNKEVDPDFKKCSKFLDFGAFLLVSLYFSLFNCAFWLIYSTNPE